MAITDLPPLRTVLQNHGLLSNKSLGQHFLFDLQLTDKIVRHIPDLNKYTVVEIGPGPGGLTRSIAKHHPQQLYVIEKDTRFLPVLDEIKKASICPLSIIHGDALEIDFHALEGQPKIFMGNLPYNISTPLLIKWLEKAFLWSSAIIMIQKEVADRLKAQPNNKTYGRLSVICQALTRVEKLFDVPPQAFVPPPKVMSSVVRLTPLPDAALIPIDTLQTLTQHAFGQRRKMLRQSLKGLGEEFLSALIQAGYDLNHRAENLTVADFINMARLLKQSSN